MPNNYENPDPKIGRGSYTWVPAPPQSIGGINPLSGFDSLEIDRGSFRNCFYNSSSQSNINFQLSKNTVKGKAYYPIRNASRPLQLGYTNVDTSGVGNIFCVGADQEAQLIAYTNILYSSRPMSTIECEYDLSFDIFGPIANQIIIDQKSIYDFTQPGGKEAYAAFLEMRAGKNFKSNEAIFLNFVNSLKNSSLVNFSGILNNSADTNYNPILIDSLPVGLNITRIRSSFVGDTPFSASLNFPAEQNVNYVTSSIKLISTNALSNNTHNDRGQYKAYKNIAFVVSDKVSKYISKPADLVLCLKKVKFFTADRVNFRFSNDQQLPAQALGYSMTINTKFYPIASFVPFLSGGTGTIVAGLEANFGGVFYAPAPYIENGCNIHVKVFNPDYTTGSPGFAHSLSLYFIIISFPFFGPLGSFFLPGVIQPYFAVVIGPHPFFTQMVFYGTSSTSDETKKLVVLSQGTNQPTNGNISVSKDGTDIIAQNIKILNFSEIYNSGTDFVNSVGSKTNPLEVPDSNSKSTAQYTNIYTNIYGQQTRSNVYAGSPQRSTVYLNGYNNLPFGNFTKKSFIYQSYVALNPKSKLQDLFFTDPALIFKLSNSNSGYITQGLTLSPGFFAATINVNEIDPSGYFDTKLVYRVYLVKKGADINPNTPDNLKLHIKIDTTDPQNYSLSLTSFDSSWGYDNVLVSGNIIQYPTSVSAEAIINVDSKYSTKTFTSKVNIPDYDFYCAVYSVSTPNENSKYISSSKLSSLSFPLVSYNIKADFIITLPLFYKLSYGNGGNLQAQKDPSYFGNYIADNHIYTLTSNTYGGKTFDNTQSYNVALKQIPFSAQSKQVSATTLSDLLILDYSNIGISSGIFTNISAGTINDPTTKTIDFIINTYSGIANAKIAKNISSDWILNVAFGDSKYPDLLFKYELDLLDSELNWSQNVITSNSFAGVGTNIDIKVPGTNIDWYLTQSVSNLILRLQITNRGPETTVAINGLTLKNNLINYFQYNTSIVVPGRASVGFYEDLPLQPLSYIDGQNQFYFVLDYTSLQNGVFLFDPLQGFYITGAIYSPTWALDTTFTKGMEVSTKGNINQALNYGFVGATGVSPYQIFFRTGIGNDVTSLDTKKHGQSQLILTVTNQKSTTSSNSVLQIVSESYNRVLLFSESLLQVLSNGDIADLLIQNPILSTSDKIYLQGQSGTDTLMLELENPASFAKQPTQTGTIAGIDNTSSRRPKLFGCIYSDLDNKENTTFSVGVTGSGCLIYSDDQNWSPINRPQFYVIEGNYNAQDIKSNASYVNISSGQAYGIVSKRFPTLCATQSGDVLVFYVYESALNKNNNIISKTAIYMKYVNGNNFSSPILVFDFKNFLVTNGGFNSNNSFPSIENLSACKDDIYSEGVLYFLAFDCLQKIFVLKITYDKHNVRVVDVLWAYGSSLKSSSIVEQNFIDALTLAVSSARVKQLSSIPYTKNLPNTQRVGFVDFDGFYMGIQFSDNLDIYEVLFEKSYLLNAVLRKIGSKSG